MKKPTLLITFDAPEMETDPKTSYVRWRSVFSLLGFTGKIKLYREALKMLKDKPFRSLSPLYFGYYPIMVAYTHMRRIQTIFDILKKYNIRATFFGIAAGIDLRYCEMNELYYNPDIFKKIIEHGHELGLHGYLHRELTEEDLMKSINLYQKILGVTPKTYSTPWGKDNFRTFELLSHYNFIGWRTWKYYNDFNQKPYKVRGFTCILNEELLDKLVSRNEVLAWNTHLIIYRNPIEVRKFERVIKMVKEREIWTPTFSEFCRSIEDKS